MSCMLEQTYSDKYASCDNLSFKFNSFSIHMSAHKLVNSLWQIVFITFCIYNSFYYVYYVSFYYVLYYVLYYIFFNVMNGHRMYNEILWVVQCMMLDIRPILFNIAVNNLIKASILNHSLMLHIIGNIYRTI